MRLVGVVFLEQGLEAWVVAEEVPYGVDQLLPGHQIAGVFVESNQHLKKIFGSGVTVESPPVVRFRRGWTSQSAIRKSPNEESSGSIIGWRARRGLALSVFPVRVWDPSSDGNAKSSEGAASRLRSMKGSPPSRPLHSG